MCAVRLLLVVELPPAFDQHLRLGAAPEPFAVEQLVAQFAVEALDEAVLPGTAGKEMIVEAELMTIDSNDRCISSLRRDLDLDRMPCLALDDASS